MSNCNKRCPVVKQQLRKLVTESPWVLQEITNGDLKVASLIRTVNDKLVIERVDVKERKDSIESYDRRSKDAGRKASNGKRVDSTQTPMYRRSSKKEKEGIIHDRSSLERRTKTSATQWSKDSRGELLKQDAAIRTDTKDGIDKANGTGEIEGVDKIDRANGTDRMDEVTKMDKETIKEEGDTDGVDKSDGLDATDKGKKMDKQDVTDETTELAMFHDECEPSCPRRISQKSRIRKLEERQRIVDDYLLNKGTRYFDDVCTCSLSCVLRALKRDSFVTSTLASIVLFTLGVKLCSELNAWYLPIRFS